MAVVVVVVVVVDEKFELLNLEVELKVSVEERETVEAVWSCWDTVGVWPMPFVVWSSLVLLLSLLSLLLSLVVRGG